MDKLTKKDLLLISKFRSNSRKTLTNLSKDTGIPISTIYDKLKEYQKGLIKQFSCLIDFKQCGYPIKSKLLIKVSSEDKKRLEKYLYYNYNVNSLFKINNGFHFLIEAIFESIQKNEHFIEEIEQKFNVITIQNYHVLKDLKREEFDLEQVN